MNHSCPGPEAINIINPEGPYGKGKTDDKVSLQKWRGTDFIQP